jgi:hypothetical protein
MNATVTHVPPPLVFPSSNIKAELGMISSRINSGSSQGWMDPEKKLYAVVERLPLFFLIPEVMSFLSASSQIPG